MRSSARREKKRKRRNALIGLLLVFLMVFSILAISLDMASDAGDLVFNDVSFRQKIVFDDVFMQEIFRFSAVFDGEEVLFFFPPSEHVSVDVSSENLSHLRYARSVLFSRSPLGEEFEFDVNLLFFDVLVSEFATYSHRLVRYGLVEHTLYESDREVINCDSASADSLVFILSDGSASPAITEVGPFCFEVVGDGESLLRVSDYLLLKVHGVI